MIYDSSMWWIINHDELPFSHLCPSLTWQIYSEKDWQYKAHIILVLQVLPYLISHGLSLTWQNQTPITFVFEMPKERTLNISGQWQNQNLHLYNQSRLPQAHKVIPMSVWQGWKNNVAKFLILVRFRLSWLNKTSQWGIFKHHGIACLQARSSISFHFVLSLKCLCGTSVNFIWVAKHRNPRSMEQLAGYFKRSKQCTQCFRSLQVRATKQWCLLFCATCIICAILLDFYEKSFLSSCLDMSDNLPTPECWTTVYYFLKIMEVSYDWRRSCLQKG